MDCFNQDIQIIVATLNGPINVNQNPKINSDPCSVIKQIQVHVKWVKDIGPSWLGEVQRELKYTVLHSPPKLSGWLSQVTREPSMYSASRSTQVIGYDRSLTVPEANNSNSLSVSSLSILRGVLPKYFSSEWSVTQFRLPEGVQHFVAFGHQKNTV